MKVKSGDEVYLEGDEKSGVIRLCVGGQTIAQYLPETDRWQAIAWVAARVGMKRKKKGGFPDDPPECGPVSFKVAE